MIRQALTGIELAVTIFTFTLIYVLQGDQYKAKQEQYPDIDDDGLKVIGVMSELGFDFIPKARSFAKRQRAET